MSSCLLATRKKPPTFVGFPLGFYVQAWGPERQKTWYNFVDCTCLVQAKYLQINLGGFMINSGFVAVTLRYIGQLEKSQHVFQRLTL